MSVRKIPDNKTLVDLYLNQKKSALEIARMYGVKNPASIYNNLRKEGVEIRTATMENHGMWKGGRTKCKGDGYKGILLHSHSRADNRGYVYEHTIVAEQKYGRLPQKGEVVHHINCDKHDNSPENLWLCSHKEHLSIHRSIEKLIKPLMESGVIIFDEEKKEYSMTVAVVEMIFRQIDKALKNETPQTKLF